MPDSTSPQGGSTSSPQHNPNFFDEQRNFRILLVYRAVLALAVVVTAVAVCLIILVCRISHHRRGQELRANKVETAKAEVLPDGSWRFIVSGDSRNCGDLVMPAIAAHSAQFAPSFYWHLGDLRTIYKIDEDMAFEAQKRGEILTCDNYERLAWSDFITNQVAPFGHVPFYIGIGNHEIIPPKNEDAFKRQFSDWLDLPVLKEQREKDKGPSHPEPYYHWIEGGVDFIYLDNASNFFPRPQLDWFHHTLDSDEKNSDVKAVVVGMHEALPDSLGNSHSMGDDNGGAEGRSTGNEAYEALEKFRDHTYTDGSHKHVYVLASHSHFYMDNIFDKLTDNHKKQPLLGWIVGTAGAVRYALPGNPPKTALTDVYGYLLATVAPNGTIKFAFQEVHEPDIPQWVRQRYPDALVPWCFARNSKNKEPKAADITPVCAPPKTGAVAPTGSSH
jgi:hypothetical protein